MKKVIFITGASSGIGHETAKLLLKKKMIVYATARRVEKMKDLKSLGAKIKYVDVRDQKTIDECIDTILKKEGRIDAVFANAGYGCLGPIECVDIKDAEDEFKVNVLGIARTIKAVLPQMRKQRKGHIIICSSTVGYMAIPHMAWYPASKHALEGLADGLRMEVKKFGIKVCKIQPAFINTEFTGPALNYLDKAAKSPYSIAYNKEIKALRNNFYQLTNPKGDSPYTVAQCVLKVICNKNPKREYTPNSKAKQVKFIKRLFGYSVLDILIPFIFLKKPKKQNRD